MAKEPDPHAVAVEMLAELRRLVQAIDRRVPHLERLSEAKIAKDAAALRARALTLIGELEAAAKTR